jgi:hypothetical protein
MKLLQELNPDLDIPNHLQDEAPWLAENNVGNTCFKSLCADTILVPQP